MVVAAARRAVDPHPTSRGVATGGLARPRPTHLFYFSFYFAENSRSTSLQRVACQDAIFCKSLTHNNIHRVKRATLRSTMGTCIFPEFCIIQEFTEISGQLRLKNVPLMQKDVNSLKLHVLYT